MKSFCCHCYRFINTVDVYVLDDGVSRFWTRTCEECTVISGVNNRGGSPTMRQIPPRSSKDVRDMCCGRMPEAVNVNMLNMCENGTQNSNVCDFYVTILM